MSEKQNVVLDCSQDFVADRGRDIGDEVVNALADFVIRTAGPGFWQPEALEALPAIAELVLDYA